MIIDVERKPTYSLYYLGYEVIKMLKIKDEISIEEIFVNLKNIISQDLNIDFVYYTLDWLYIVSTIKINGEKVFLSCY
ncbi:MAG: hypothetical protein HFJ25_00125 [Clostridia bacterium]|nr:hypothetical protein [Clostridia bacterium]